jgi:hypothetical protein
MVIDILSTTVLFEQRVLLPLLLLVTLLLPAAFLLGGLPPINLRGECARNRAF